MAGAGLYLKRMDQLKEQATDDPCAWSAPPERLDGAGLIICPETLRRIHRFVETGAIVLKILLSANVSLYKLHNFSCEHHRTTANGSGSDLRQTKLGPSMLLGLHLTFQV